MIDGNLLPEIPALVTEIEDMLDSDHHLKRIDRLYRCFAVQTQLQRLWDLLVVETHDIARHAEQQEDIMKSNADSEAQVALGQNAITYDAYIQFHTRIAVLITEEESIGSSEARGEDGCEPNLLRMGPGLYQFAIG